jgi:hypothetical protein
VNFCRSESRTSVQEVGVSERALCFALVRSEAGYYLLLAEPSHEKAGWSVYTETATFGYTFWIGGMKNIG